MGCAPCDGLSAAARRNVVAQIAPSRSVGATEWGEVWVLRLSTAARGCWRVMAIVDGRRWLPVLVPKHSKGSPAFNCGQAGQSTRANNDFARNPDRPHSRTLKKEGGPVRSGKGRLAGRSCRLIPHRGCWQKCLASSSPRIVGVRLTLWGALESFGGNERVLLRFARRHIKAGLIENSAK